MCHTASHPSLHYLYVKVDYMPTIDYTIDSLVKHLCKALSKNLNQTGLNLK